MNTLELGSNTPEKNSVSGDAPANPIVVSQSVDGSGPVITLSGTPLDCLIQLIAQLSNGTPNPASGSVTIRLSDCNGQNLSIQPISLCMNGVSGTMYFLCSQFIPDSGS